VALHDPAWSKVAMQVLQALIDGVRTACAAQGHSILITSGSAICQDAVEVHGVAPQSIGDVVDLVEPQNIEGEAAQDGEDDRALADATGAVLCSNRHLCCVRY